MDIPYLELYEKAVLIRKFEMRLLQLFSEGKLFGTTHTYVGQEATAVSLISQLQDSDIVFSNHRCHGHYLSKHNDPEGLLAEIMGKNLGVCAGRGGSQHLCKKNFFSNGIQGGFLPNALGMAFAEKHKKTDAIVTAFIGDGTLGEGSVYETLNLASLWAVPLLVVVENNRYAQTTPIEKGLAGSISKRAEAFDVFCLEVESNDVEVLFPISSDAINFVRANKKPCLLVVHTYRLTPHSKGDDFRDKAEIAYWEKKDPLGFFNERLSNDERDLIQRTVDSRLAKIEELVSKAPLASFETV